MGGSKRWTFSETVDIGGQSADNRDFTVCIIRCVYRAELILGREFTLKSYKDLCRIISIHKVRLRYINVPRIPWNLCEFTRFSCQLQVSSARASHFLDVETCEFPSLRYLNLTFMN